MADKTLNVRVKHKYDTEANWKNKNPVLLQGEIGFINDGRYKVGNGTSKWNDLQYATADSLVGHVSGEGFGYGYAYSKTITIPKTTAATTYYVQIAKDASFRFKNYYIKTNGDNTQYSFKAEISANAYMNPHITLNSQLYNTSEIKSILICRGNNYTHNIFLVIDSSTSIAKTIYIQSDNAILDTVSTTAPTTTTELTANIVNDSYIYTSKKIVANITGSASSVPWNGVTGKPSTFTPSSHTHDDRYYTESEINSKLSGKSDTNHSHNLSTMINGLDSGTATPSDSDYYISQWAGGGTSNTSAVRRPHSALWQYIKGKADSVYQPKGSYAASSHTHSISNISGLQSALDGKANNHSHPYLPLSGGTVTGALTAPNVTASNYFTTPTMLGEGDLSTYYHRVDFGHSGVNQFDFYEYGGIYNFYQNQSAGKDKAVLLGKITSNGWEGNVVGNVTGNATSATTSSSCSGNSATATKLANSRTIGLTGLSSGYANFDGSGNVSIENWGYGCKKYVTQGDTAKPYFRIAHCESNGSYSDNSIVFVIDSGYAGGGFGIVKVCMRTNNITTKDTTSCDVHWLVRNTFTPDQLFVKGYSPAGGTQYCDLYFKASGSYNAITVTVLSSGGRGNKTRTWTFEEADPRAAADIRTYSFTTNGVDNGIAATANIASQANKLYLTSANNYTTFNWVGKDGQPNWLWGGNDVANMYVYNPSNFSVKYATSAGSAGSASSATTAGTCTGNSATATALTSSAGSATQPVYFSNGKPVACTYTLGKSVPSNAVFTDTNTWRPLGTTADTACAGNDSRLSNARPASDVYSWAKASSKPSYSWNEISGKPGTFNPSSHNHTDLDTIGTVGYYGSDVANSNGWYKVYSTTLTNYNDHVARLSIVGGYSPIASGLLTLHLRCDNTTTLKVQQLIWETRQGFNADDVIINTNGNTWTLYLKITNSQYGRVKIRVLESMSTSSNWSMSLSNNSTKESANPTATATAKDGATVSYANSAGSVAWNGISGKPALVGKTIKSLTAASSSGWSDLASAQNLIPDMSVFAYWNGAYSGAASNLAYCNKGAFGTIVTRNAGDYASTGHNHDSAYAPKSHTHNYAGSSSAGGSANSAVKLDSSAGSAESPVYFSSGKPATCSFSLLTQSEFNTAWSKG